MAQAVVELVRLARAERFPAASVASTPNEYVVPHASPVMLKLTLADVPAAAPLRDIR